MFAKSKAAIGNQAQMDALCTQATIAPHQVVVYEIAKLMASVPSSNAIILSHNERLKASKKLANRYISFFGSGPVSRLVFKKRVKQINDAVRAVALKKLRRSPAMLAKFSLDTPRSSERFAM